MTGDAARVATLVGAAASTQAMVWITGPRGVGKTRAVRRALETQDIPLVEPLRLDRENLHLGDIQAAIVRDLSDETLRRSGEARSGQVRRILGTVRRPPVLFIDESHALHHAAVRGLKRLRELSWLNRPAPLLGIVLAGQREPSARMAEVTLRSARLTMAGLSREEAGRAVADALNRKGRVIGFAALKHLSGDDRARNWLDLQQLVDAAIALALARGLDQIDDDVAAAVVGAVARTQASAPAPAPKPAAPSDEAVSAVLGRQGAAAASA
ncbi:MAG: AAA family ATPase [Rhodospirillaceae bacterium]|nr:AAA family ATPase [Rhodospirillaceae bacterium]